MNHPDNPGVDHAVPHPLNCSGDFLHTVAPNASRIGDFPVCTSELATFAIDIVHEQTQEVVGQFTGFENQPAPVIDVGVCDVNGQKPPQPGFPSPEDGGPPAALNAVEFDFPAFNVDRNTTELTNASTPVTLSAAMKVPDPVNPSQEVDYTFAREQTLTGTNQVATTDPFRVVGYTVTVSAQEPGTIGLRAYTRKQATGFCYLVSPEATRDVSVQVIEEAGTYAQVFGANLNPPPNACDDVGEGQGPHCYGRVNQGCPPAEGQTHWRSHYTAYQPLDCHPSVLQSDFMLMKKAGIEWVKPDMPWNAIEPQDVIWPPEGDEEPRFHFNDAGYDLDVYVRMARKYGIDVLGFPLSDRQPYWISSCCTEGWSADQCNADLQEKGYGITFNQCAPRPDSGPGPDEFWCYGKFAQFFVEVLSRYKPGGGLALEDPDWPDNDPYGITH
ncbi:MAG: hypothetical protein HYY13_08510 [Nitrospirae bacterium]|nr:hypothetical protein [Nitrospirota bacterium]